MHYKTGRLVSIDLEAGDAMTAEYDGEGRLTAMTTSYAGKPESVTRYKYDAEGRLVEETWDRQLDGVDGTCRYSCSCTSK